MICVVNDLHLCVYVQVQDAIIQNQTLRCKK